MLVLALRTESSPDMGLEVDVCGLEEGGKGLGMSKGSRSISAK